LQVPVFFVRENRAVVFAGLIYVCHNVVAKLLSFEPGHDNLPAAF
jgi:hypothetical protein